MPIIELSAKQIAAIAILSAIVGGVIEWMAYGKWTQILLWTPWWIIPFGVYLIPIVLIALYIVKKA